MSNTSRDGGPAAPRRAPKDSPERDVIPLVQYAEVRLRIPTATGGVTVDLPPPDEYVVIRTYGPGEASAADLGDAIVRTLPDGRTVAIWSYEDA